MALGGDQNAKGNPSSSLDHQDGTQVCTYAQEPDQPVSKILYDTQQNDVHAARDPTVVFTRGYQQRANETQSADDESGKHSRRGNAPKRGSDSHSPADSLPDQESTTGASLIEKACRRGALVHPATRNTVRDEDTTKAPKEMRRRNVRPKVPDADSAPSIHNEGVMQYSEENGQAPAAPVPPSSTGACPSETPATATHASQPTGTVYERKVPATLKRMSSRRNKTTPANRGPRVRGHLEMEQHDTTEHSSKKD